jgi:hypothetical protein
MRQNKLLSLLQRICGKALRNKFSANNMPLLIDFCSNAKGSRASIDGAVPFGFANVSFLGAVNGAEGR